MGVIRQPEGSKCDVLVAFTRMNNPKDPPSLSAVIGQPKNVIVMLPNIQNHHRFILIRPSLCTSLFCNSLDVSIKSHKHGKAFAGIPG